jgi:hypothetical protein
LIDWSTLDVDHVRLAGVAGHFVGVDVTLARNSL